MCHHYRQDGGSRCVPMWKISKHSLIMKFMRKEARPWGRINSDPWRFLRKDRLSQSLLLGRWNSGIKKALKHINTETLEVTCSLFVFVQEGKSFHLLKFLLSHKNIKTNIKEEWEYKWYPGAKHPQKQRPKLPKLQLSQLGSNWKNASNITISYHIIQFESPGFLQL